MSDFGHLEGSYVQPGLAFHPSIATADPRKHQQGRQDWVDNRISDNTQRFIGSNASSEMDFELHSSNSHQSDFSSNTSTFWAPIVFDSATLNDKNDRTTLLELEDETVFYPDVALSVRTDRSTLEREQQQQTREYETIDQKSSKTNQKRHLTVSCCTKVIIFGISGVSIVMCSFLWFRLLFHIDTSNSLSKAMLRLPCGNISFYPATNSMYNTRHKTNQNPEEARSGVDSTRSGLSKLTDTNGLCEVPLAGVMADLVREDPYATKGTVQLRVGETGPNVKYSKYTLSTNQPELSFIGSDPTAVSILVDGYYFVFFGLTLNYGDNSACRLLRYKTSISHLLVEKTKKYKSTRRRIRTLIGSEHTCCFRCATENATEYAGGLFQLSKGDRLFVQISTPSIISSIGGNYIGLFRLH